MTIHVSIKEAKNRLSDLIRSMERGERVIVTRRGEPVFEMVTPRPGGIDFAALDRWKEERGLPRHIVGPLPKDFDDPLPEDFLITPLRYPDEAEQK
ncbi:type II toxin-antitoxin system Phd/YefM family antitoxin [Enterovirga sp. GCM10030262]|uniref:type II toxin-antitoxin system Phd/YefM family antitoxin n=1 Tax=Enterovirga sp. GCM10030262 TaxID=3273391 RepID=UPI00361B0531